MSKIDNFPTPLHCYELLFSQNFNVYDHDTSTLQTDGQKTCLGNSALRVTSRGKKQNKQNRTAFCSSAGLQRAALIKLETPADAMVTRDSSACMKALGTHQLSNVSRHLGFLTFGSCIIRSAYPENPTLEPNTMSLCCIQPELC